MGLGVGGAVGVETGAAGSACGDPAGDGLAAGVVVGVGVGAGAGVALTGARGATPVAAGTPSGPCRWIHQKLRAAGAEHQRRRDQEGEVAARGPPRRRARCGGAAHGLRRASGVRLRPPSRGLLLGGRELGEVGQVLRAPLGRALQAPHDRARELARQVGRDFRERGRQLAARAADDHLPGDRARRVDVGLQRGRPPFVALRSGVAGLRRAALGGREVTPEVARDLDPRGLERGEGLAPVVDRVQGLAQPLDEAQPLGERVSPVATRHRAS